MSIALLTCTATVGGLVDAAEHIRRSSVASVCIQHILTVLEGDKGIGNPFACTGIDKVVNITTTTERSVRIAVEAMVVFLVEDEDDTLVTKSRNLIVSEAIQRLNTLYDIAVLVLCVFNTLGGIIQTIDRLEGLPHTGIVHVVEHRVGVLRRTATLEVHTTNILTTLYPASGEVGELRIEVVIGTVSETSLSGLVLIMLSGHQDLREPLVGTVNTRPLGIEIPVIGSQRACGNHLVTERDHTVQVCTLVILGSPGSATLRLTVQQSLSQEVGGGVLGPCAVSTPFLRWQHLVGFLELGDDKVQRFLLRCTGKVLFDVTVSGLGLECHTTILCEQTVVIVSTQEVSLTESLVTAVLVFHVVCLADNQVGSRDAVIHLIPEGRYGWTVLIGCTQSLCTVEGVQTVVVGVPALRGEVGTIGELVASIERDAVSPLITEVPAYVCIESGSHLQGSSLVFEQCVAIKVSGILFQEVVTTRGHSRQGKHRQRTAN